MQTADSFLEKFLGGKWAVAAAPTMAPKLGECEMSTDLDPYSIIWG